MYNIILIFASNSIHIFMILTKRYTNSSHPVFNIGHHILFYLKYCQKVLVDGVTID